MSNSIGLLESEVEPAYDEWSKARMLRQNDLVGHATCKNTMTLSTGQILAASFVAATIASAELVGDMDRRHTVIKRTSNCEGQPWTEGARAAVLNVPAAHSEVQAAAWCALWQQ